MSKFIVEEGSDMGGGDYVRVTLPGGKVVFVWADSVERPGSSLIEVFHSVEAVESGDHRTLDCMFVEAN